MLIASKIHRPNAPIVLGQGADQRTYYFRPYEPTNPNSEHVAEVANDDDIATLLAIREGYHIAQSGKAIAAKPASQPAPLAPVVTPSAPADTTAPPVTDSTGQDASITTSLAANVDITDPEIEKAALSLHELGANQFKAEVRKGGIPAAVLGAALRIEQAKAEDDQRETLIKVLREAGAA